MGIWREGSALDTVDKQLSRPIFDLRLPVAAELLLSVPGAFMGFPHSFLGSTPLVLAWISSQLAGGSGSIALAAAAMLSWMAGIALFYGGLAGWFDTVKVIKVLVLGMYAATCLVLAMAPADACAVGLLSLTAANVVVALLVPVKAAFGRLRPAPALRLIDHVNERRSGLMAPYIEGMCSAGGSEDSMPSADVGIMAANATLLWGMGLRGPAILLVALSMFGRMYFWAHHLLDVFCGFAVGALVTKSLQMLRPGWQWTRAHMAFVLLIVSVAAMKRRMRK